MEEGQIEIPRRPYRVDMLSDVYRNLSWEDRWKINSRYHEDKKAYDAAIAAYIQKHGTKGMSQERIRIALKAEKVYAIGGIRILEYRWKRLMQGEPVQHAANYHPHNVFPEYSLYPTQLSSAFERTSVLCIPLNVWAAHIFQHISNADLFQLMLTCKQFQARAHTELFMRAQSQFGRFGTPMALHAQCLLGADHNLSQEERKLFHIKLSKTKTVHVGEAIEMAIKVLGCVDYAKTFSSYQRDQRNIRLLEAEEEQRFSIDAFNHVKPIVERLFGERYSITWFHPRRCAKFVDFQLAYFGDIFDRPFCRMILTNCSRLVNSDRTDTTSIEKSLKKWKPTAFEDALLNYLFQSEIRDTLYANIKKHCSQTDFTYNYIDNLIRLVQILCAETEKRGMRWLENTVKFSNCFTNHVIEQCDSCRFVSMNNWVFSTVSVDEFSMITKSITPYKMDQFQVFDDYISEGVSIVKEAAVAPEPKKKKSKTAN